MILDNIKSSLAAMALVALSPALLSCDDDDYVKNVAGGEPYFEMPELADEIKMDVKGTELTTWGAGKRYLVRSNAHWSVVPADENGYAWAKVFPMEGTGDGYLRFYTDANPSPIRRTAKYNIIVDGIAQPFEVTVRQEESPAVFNVSSRNVCFARNGGKVDVAMESNLDWDVEVAEGYDWISASRENNLIRLSTSATATADGQHAGKVRVYAVDYPEFASVINVSQTGAVYFDDFSWLIANSDNYAPQIWAGQDLRIDKWVPEQTELNPGWTSVGNYVYSRWHFIKTGTGSNIGDICAPAVADIPKGSDITVSWNIAGYCNKSNVRDPGNVFRVAILGDGAITAVSANGGSTASNDGKSVKYTSNGKKGGASTTLTQSAAFSIGADAYFDTDEPTGLDVWENPEAQFSMNVSGAGPKTRIVFIFGDGGVENKWKPVEFKTMRFGFDNFKIEIR